MSLYAGTGINLPKNKPTVEAPAVAQPAAAPAATPAVSTAESVELPATASKAAGNWSAALRFAPSIRKKPTASAAASRPAAFRNAFASADDSNVTPAKAPRIVGNAKPSLASASATPEQAIASPVASTSRPVSTPAISAPSSTPARVGRTILKPPPMTLDDDDVKGFKQTAAGKRAVRNEGKSGRKKGKKREDPALQFGDTPYDAARPCDYSAYKAHVQALRTQRRLEQEEERRRARSSSGSSYESGSDGERSDEDPRFNKKARFFAPPTSYDDAPSRSALGQPATDEPLPPPAPAVRVSREETGEEAYLRRVAMSKQGATAAAPPQPARPAPPPSFSPASYTSSSVHPPFQAQSDVSQFSLSPAPPPAPPGFIPPTFFAPPGADDFPPFQPPTIVSAAPVTSGTASPDTNAAIADAQAKAREIAARLGKLSAFQPPPPTTTASASLPTASDITPHAPQEPAASAEPDNRSFADRMMAKFGWEEGKGLGASESGMTTALSVAKPTSASKKMKKKQEQEEPTPTGMAAKRATIVDSTRESRIANQKAELGEPSRVVLLTNLCGLDDLDDELGDEVAQEANKFGVCERCFVYQVAGETRDEESVRVFLVMSGLAGGYNAVRQFDGRFFGGRTVKARFYNEQAFNSGQHTLPTAS